MSGGLPSSNSTSQTLGSRYMRSRRQPSPWKQTLFLIAAALGLANAGAARSAGSADAAEEFDWNKAREFWSFQAPKAQPLPRLQNKRWPRERMDNFILAAMEKRHLSPSLEADRRTL